MLRFLVSSRSRAWIASSIGLALAGAFGAELGCTPTHRTLVDVGGSSSASAVASASSASASSSGGGSVGAGGSSGDAGMDGAGGSACSDSCGDPACLAAGYQCAPDPPPDAGWIGPGYLYNAMGTAPGCGPAWAPPTSLGGAGSVTWVPATCAACTCGSPAGGACGQITVELAHDSACGVSVDSTTSALGACAEAFVPAGSTYAKATIAATGTCTPAGGTNLTMTPPAFETSVATCVGPTTMPLGCASDATCLPAAPAGYLGGVCIYQAGDVACPPGYANKTLAYKGVDDTRACSPCTCTAATGRSCAGQLTYFEDAILSGCTGPDVSIPTGACVPVPTPTKDEAFYVGEAQGAPDGGSCANDGGAPTGTVTATGPTTICCQ